MKWRTAGQQKFCFRAESPKGRGKFLMTAVAGGNPGRCEAIRIKKRLDGGDGAKTGLEKGFSGMKKIKKCALAGNNL